jgi:hypothetical protein
MQKSDWIVKNSAPVHFNFKQRENTQAQKVWYFFPNKHVYFQINSVYFQNKQRKTLTLTHPIFEEAKFTPAEH